MSPTVSVGADSQTLPPVKSTNIAALLSCNSENFEHHFQCVYLVPLISHFLLGTLPSHWLLCVTARRSSSMLSLVQLTWTTFASSAASRQTTGLSMDWLRDLN